jgi:hypothetical protein
MATGGTTTARGSRATDGTTHDNGRHDNGKGQQGDRRHDDHDGRHDDGDWRHDDGQHDNGNIIEYWRTCWYYYTRFTPFFFVARMKIPSHLFCTSQCAYTLYHYSNLINTN